MQPQKIFIQVYDVDGISLDMSTDVISASGQFALNRIGSGSFRVPASAAIAEHLEIANHVWIWTQNVAGVGNNWFIQQIIISEVSQVDDENGKFIDVRGESTESLLNFRRTGTNTFDSDVTPVLPAIMDFAPLFTHEVTGAATAPSLPVYLVSANHSVFELLRQAAEQTGDSFYIDGNAQKVWWYGDTVSSGITFSIDSADAPIISIRRQIQGESPITKLKAFGAGTGADALRLDTVPLTNEDKAALEAQFPGISWSPQMYLWKSSLEITGYSLKDGEIRFPYIRPRAEVEGEVGYDADAELYKAVYMLNQTAGSYFYSLTVSRTLYEVKSIVSDYSIQVGATARLTYNNVIELEPGEYRVDEDLFILSVRHNIGEDGIRYSTITLSDSIDEWLDPNQKIVKKLAEQTETNRATSSPPSEMVPVTPVHHHSLLGLDDDDHPQYLRADGGTPLVGNLVVGGTYTIDGVDISAHAADAAAHHDPATAGDGLTITGQQLNVGAGNGLTLAADSVALTTPGSLTATSTNNAAGSHTHAIDSTIARSAVQIIAGDGLTGGGDLTDSRTLNVVVGNGLTVTADSIALTAPGTLTVTSTNNAAGSHTHAITSSSNPGAAASLLATTAAGALTLASLAVTGNITAGAVNSHWIPATTTTYDLGSITKLWNKAYLGELWSSVLVGSTPYASRATGWQVNAAGEADFRSIFADSLEVQTFIVDNVLATAGTEILTKSLSTLSRDFTVAASATIYVFDLPGSPDVRVFADGDTIRLRSISRTAGLIVSDVFGTVASYTNLADGEQSYTFTKTSGTDGLVIYAGATVLDYGASGDGFIISTVADTYSPYTDVRTWVTAPGTDTTHTRLGNLQGITAVDEFGLYTGISATQKFIASDGRLELHGAKFSLYKVTTETIRLDPIGPSLAIGLTIPTYGDDGIWMGLDDGNIKFRAGNANDYVHWDGTLLTVAGKLLIDGNSEFVGAVTLGTSGGIYQGTGTFASPTTGLKIWNNSGIGRIAGYNAAVEQVGFDTDGKLKAGAGAVILASDGITILPAGASYLGSKALKFTDGGADRASIYAGLNGTLVMEALDGAAYNTFELSATTSALTGNFEVDTLIVNESVAVKSITMGQGDSSNIWFYYLSTQVGQFTTSDTTWFRINQSVAKNIYTPQAIVAVTGFSTESAVLPSGGQIVYNSNLIARRASASHTGYIYVPYTTKKTNTSWDGDSKSAANNGTLDLSALFGVPANVKAVYARLSIQSATINQAVGLGPSSGQSYYLLTRTQVANQYIDACGIVNCDSNGDMYITITGTNNIFIEIFGYFI